MPNEWLRRNKYPIALIVGILAVQHAIAAATARFLDRPFSDGFALVTAVFSGILLSVVLGAWLRSVSNSGRVVLDCGRDPTWIVGALQAIVFLPVAIIAVHYYSTSRDPFDIANALIFSSLGVPGLVMATGRLQFRENGIRLNWHLLPWSKIASCRWADDSTLLVRRKGAIFSFRSKLAVPPERKHFVEELLAKHCPIQMNS